MKTETVNTDWLNHIDGLTVGDAIEYLKTLDESLKLTYFQASGDDQGVSISSELTFEREETTEELETIRVQRIERNNKRLRDSAAYYEKEALYFASIGNETRAEYYKRRVAAQLSKVQVGAG